MTLSGTEAAQQPYSSSPPSMSDGRERPDRTDYRLLNAPAASAAVIRIAEALGVDPRALASEIPEDTLRRTRYAALEVYFEDGKRMWKHPVYEA